MSGGMSSAGANDSNLHANLPGTASLIAELDRKQMVLLRDGRTLIGTLRSVDQFANLVLQDCIERIHVGKQFGDIPRGIFVVRGENVVLLGEVDTQADVESRGLERIGLEEILEKQSQQQADKEEKERQLAKAFKEHGLSYAPDSIE